MPGFSNPTPEQITELRCAVGGRVECEQLEPLPDLNRIWSCPFFPFPGLACQFNVRAKRLIAYPNELELVWFDDFEFNNPTFGLLWRDSRGTARSLCSARPPVRDTSRCLLYAGLCDGGEDGDVGRTGGPGTEHAGGKAGRHQRDRLNFQLQAYDTAKLLAGNCLLLG